MAGVYLVVQVLAEIAMAVMLGLVKLAGLLVAAALWLNSTLLDVSSSGMNGFVSDGWVLFRDLANLGFVFGIIVIAFATIFRIKSYSASQILWKLVVAALLVNFSLVIMSPFIMVSQNFSNYFLQKVTGSDSENMFTGAALKTVAIFNPITYQSGSFWSDVAAGAAAGGAIGGGVGAAAGAVTGAVVNVESQSMANAVTAVIGVFIQTIIFMTLLSFSVVLLVRYFFVAFLMILSPIVWLLWIFPSTSKHFKKWWDEFVKWMIYPPIVLFFLDLSLILYNASTVSGTTSQWSSFQNVLAGEGAQYISKIPFSTIMGSLMAVAMLIGGMMVASKIGVVGGEMATGMAQKTANYTKGKAKEYGARSVKAAKDSSVGKDALAKVKGATNRIPFVGAGISRSISRGEASVDKHVKERDEAKLAGMSDKNRAEAAKYLFGNAKYTEMAKAIESGLGGSYSIEDVRKLSEGLKAMGKHQDAEKALRARGLSEAAIRHYMSGDMNAFIQEQARVASTMNSSERELWMKNDGKNIAEGKYLGLDKTSPSWVSSVQGGIYESSYSDSAAMRSMAGNIHGASAREDYLMKGVPQKIADYEARVNEEDKKIKLVSADIAALDAKKKASFLSADEGRKLESLTKKLDRLSDGYEKMNDDLGKVRTAYKGGDPREVKKAMEMSEDSTMKAYASGMKLMG